VTGKFTLRDTVGTGDPRLKVFVAAGTGLAPFVSMVRSHHLRDAAADFGKYLVLHGASYPGDLGYRDELESYVARHRLKYRVTVSRPQESAGWTGDTGRVEDYFLPERLSELEGWLGLAPGGLQPARAVVYICGLQGTIGNTITRLVSRGFVPEHRKIRRALGVPDQVPASLFYEQYDTTPVIPIDDESFMAPLREQMRAALTTVS
jgi:ferredoxin--NADP+ reductase